MSNILTKGYGILPNEVMYHEELSSSAKLFFCCVSSHMAKRGYSFASNRHFAELMGVKERQIQRWLDELSGYLFVYQENGQRRITFYPNDPESWGVSKKTGGGVKKDTHNNTSLINKKINKKEEKEFYVDLDSLFSSLVKSLGRKVETTRLTPARRTKLKARLKLYTSGDLVKTALSIAANDFMVKGGHNNIDYLLRNDEKVEYWLNKYQEPEAPKKGMSRVRVDDDGNTYVDGKLVTPQEYAQMQDEIVKEQMES